MKDSLVNIHHEPAICSIVYGYNSLSKRKWSQISFQKIFQFPNYNEISKHEPANIYLFKVNNRNIRKSCEI